MEPSFKKKENTVNVELLDPYDLYCGWIHRAGRPSLHISTMWRRNHDRFLKVPKQCFITSNNESCDESVTNTLHKNCEWQKNDDDNASTIRLETFDWEQDNDYQKVMDMINDQCDIIIGSDILNYTLNIPRRLLDTICKMMVNSASSRSDVKFICSHSMKFGRSHLDSIENYCMEELNMKMNVIEWKSFVPEPIPLPISNYGRRDVVILVFQLLYPN